MSNKEYVVVKHADDVYWEHYFLDDPKLGVHKMRSAHFTPTGLSLGLKHSYASPEEAEIDCKKINADNPCGGYAVCPVI